MAEHQTPNKDHDKRFNPPGVQKPFNHDVHLIGDVKEALMKGTRSAGIDVRVEAEDGVVRLTGVVDVLSHKTTAEEIARRIPGVRRIVNDIAIADEEHQTDKHLLGQLTQKLSQREELQQVGCRVHKGVVSLVGHAGSNGDLQDAIRLVEGTPGVREVRALRVKIGEGEKEDDADLSRSAEQMIAGMGHDHTLFQVYSDAGVLFVKGFVPAKEDRSRLKTELHKLPGVDKLEATLVTNDELGGEIH